MKWERDGTWWIAIGQKGTFHVRRRNYMWVASYLPKGATRCIWICRAELLSEVKRRCEYNYRWEVEKIKRK